MREVPNPEWTHAASYLYDSQLDPETDDPPSYSSHLRNLNTTFKRFKRSCSRLTNLVPVHTLDMR
ncbi:hypothetical protein GYMLUDRAFT_554470 [Collybiopsis luxurians FD-317 M1]|uniref:Uncharacterized protein n=1 Tax=Collybiopsis luxurians FD-317 M1 TaxID=944289 RepID=A0A0D0CSF9_9AGAR|nr:hypothetical protein GYMLUDRAFT_554470 [Collybiopsis luxurians FD-317 M1]